ncbi:DUF4177 domain-containing protein [Flavobacteriaceae bacterium F08102]|nr:DUF4177 domain-containing protein [Flavobacteriaceae bacterium F08102]
MKEYKVVKPKLGWKNTQQKLEDVLNTYAREGWRVIEILPKEVQLTIIFERNKNR